MPSGRAPATATPTASCQRKANPRSHCGPPLPAPLPTLTLGGPTVSPTANSHTVSPHCEPPLPTTPPRVGLRGPPPRRPPLALATATCHPNPRSHCGPPLPAPLPTLTLGGPTVSPTANSHTVSPHCEPPLPTTPPRAAARGWGGVPGRGRGRIRCQRERNPRWQWGWQWGPTV